MSQKLPKTQFRVGQVVYWIGVAFARITYMEPHEGHWLLWLENAYGAGSTHVSDQVCRKLTKEEKR